MTRRATRDYSEYLGRPWIRGEYDCWSLVADLYRDELQVDLPRFPDFEYSLKAAVRELTTNPLRDRFLEVTEPAHLSVVEFLTRDGATYHVGVYLETADGPRIAHNHKSSGVVLDTPGAVLADLRYWIYQ